jgi:hypothetical protein
VVAANDDDEDLMKRDVLGFVGCVMLSIVLFSGSVYLSLQVTDWGRFNSEPPGKRPSVSVALASKHRTAVVFHVSVLPLISVAVGFLSGTLARRPRLVAALGILPLRLYYLSLEDIRFPSLLSAGIGIGLAVLAANVWVHLRHKRKALSIA